jgi:hypothetical protein
MGPEASFPCTQEFATCLYPEPDESNPLSQKIYSYDSY